MSIPEQQLPAVPVPGAVGAEQESASNSVPAAPSLPISKHQHQHQHQHHHVVMVAFSAQGHINPLLRLGRSLQSKGIHVTLATTPAAYNRINHRTTTTTSCNNNNNNSIISDIRIKAFSDGYDDNAAAGEVKIHDYFETLAKFGPINLTKLIQDLQSTSNCSTVSCIIMNPFVPWVADVAQRLGIPCAMLWIQPCAVLSIYYRFYNSLDAFPTSDHPDIKSVDLPGLPSLKTVDLPTFVLPSNPFRSFPDMLSEILQNTHKIKWVLANSFYELESSVIDSINQLLPGVRPVGPLVPPFLLTESSSSSSSSSSAATAPNTSTSSCTDMWTPDEDCLRWLDEMPPRSVIYISYGSFAVMPEKSIRSIADALKITNRPFLWVAKPSDREDADQNANRVPAGFEEETRDQGRVVQWCPQANVLSHSAVGCFLTHCGWNSVLESLCSGVPIICYPQWTDQPTNAKLVADVFEVGIRMWPAGRPTDQHQDVVESGEVVRCIEELMAGPHAQRIRENAQVWKRAAREAVAQGGSSDTNIQWFVDQITRVSP